MLVKQKIKYIQSLGQKKFREQEQLFLAEGPKLVADMLETGNAAIREIYALPEWIRENSSITRSVPVIEINETELERISQWQTPNQVVALVEQFNEPESIDTQGQIILVLDTIQDPGNLGTLIRLADWFGIKQIVCSETSADQYNSKVVQATMGSIARVSVVYRDLNDWLSALPDTVILATTLDGAPVQQAGKMTAGILIIGNESKGISAEVLSHATKKITIPRKGHAESLNAAIAAGIILSHIV